jgi:hypothetical protein
VLVCNDFQELRGFLQVLLHSVELVLGQETMSSRPP